MVRLVLLVALVVVGVVVHNFLAVGWQHRVLGLVHTLFRVHWVVGARVVLTHARRRR